MRVDGNPIGTAKKDVCIAFHKPVGITCTTERHVRGNIIDFINHPQRIFPIPEGILNHRGQNHVALAVTSDGQPGDALETVRLVTLRNVKGGLPVQMVTAPNAPSDLKETK